jgi:hypothetical protein
MTNDELEQELIDLAERLAKSQDAEQLAVAGVLFHLTGCYATGGAHGLLNFIAPHIVACIDKIDRQRRRTIAESN